MIDTVVLRFIQGTYTVLDSARFNDPLNLIDSSDPEERTNFLNTYKGHREYNLNPSPSYREQGIVCPNVTLAERIDMRSGAYTRNLNVSISLPKLLWGHSFQELMDANFVLVVRLLVERLKIMGIVVTEESTRNAVVQTLHYCSNIMFPTMEEARMFLDRIYKCSLGKWFENNEKWHSNDGATVRFHAKVFEIVFYLKYYDVLERNDRSVDRKKTPQEKEIAKRVMQEGRIPPLVRLEIRCNGKPSIRSHLKASLGMDRQTWTFQEVFSSTNSRNFQKYYWSKIIDDPLNKICLSTIVDRDVCLRVYAKFKGDKVIVISESLGLFYQLKNLGIKTLREIIESKHKNRQAWYMKRKKIIDFARRFVNQDETLIKIVTEVLEKKPMQLELPL